MSEQERSPNIARLIQQGLARGWCRPCLLAMCPHVEQAESLYEMIKGVPMPQFSPSDCPAISLAAPVLAKVLPATCGAGGDLAARQLLDPALPIDGWFVSVESDGITMSGFSKDGEMMFRREVAYQQGKRKGKTFGEDFKSDGPGVAPLLLRSGEQVTVYGRSGSCAAISAVLVGVVKSRVFTVEDQGRMVDVPMNDDAIVAMLLKAYSDEYGPHRIAEAVTALKKLPGNHANKFMRLLRNRPALQQLWSRVKTELTGEASCV